MRREKIGRTQEKGNVDWESEKSEGIREKGNKRIRMQTGKGGRVKRVKG